MSIFRMAERLPGRWSVSQGFCGVRGFQEPKGLHVYEMRAICRDNRNSPGTPYWSKAIRRYWTMKNHWSDPIRGPILRHAIR